MKVLIADDHALFRDGLTMQLEKIDPKAIIFQASNYLQALKFFENEPNVDLVILDLDMQDMHWEDGFEKIKNKSNGAKMVVISASEDAKQMRKALDSGINGYIPKRADTKILTGALKLIMDGGTYLPSKILDDKNEDSDLSAKKQNKKLTKRQFQVLSLIAQGKSNKQIAYEMGVSEATVKLHINALLRSLNATNRTQAVITAQKHGII